MPHIAITRFGLGMYTDDSPGKIPLGSARSSKNIHHNRGTGRAKLRSAIDRVWATRIAASATLAAYEYVSASGTRVLLTKHGTSLYTFALTPGTALGSILASMTASFLPAMCTALGYVHIADSGKNYISGGTSGTTYELQKAAPTGVITLASAGTATGNASGTIYYSYTDVTPEGVESPPYVALAVTRTADQGVTVTNSSLSFTAPYTTKNLYRSTAGSNQMYRVTTALVAASFPYADTSLDTALTTVSLTHLDDSVSAGIEKPGAAKHNCFHKGRLFLANFSGNTNRLRWSQIETPTQFSNQTDAYADIGNLDGGDITGLVSFRGSLVIFKTTSIWVMNGDADETNFVFFEAVPGKGCAAPRTIVADGDDRILFLSACGLLSFDLSGVPKIPLSAPIAVDLDDLEYADRWDRFCAGIDLCEREYLLSVTIDGGTTNTKTHAYSLDTGAWGMREWNMGQITPSCYTVTGGPGQIRAANDKVKLYFGDDNGYLYEVDSETGADGITSGDKSGTVTGATATTTTCSAAAFRTTGNGLTGLGMTVYRAADKTYETTLISSNTATIITHAALSGTAVAVDDTVYVGAYEGLLSLNRLDLGTVQRKRYARIEIAFEKATHAIKLKLGYSLEDGTVPTATTEYLLNTGYKARLPIHRSGHGLSPYLDIIGVSHSLDILGVSVDADVYATFGPTS